MKVTSYGVSLGLSGREKKALVLNGPYKEDEATGEDPSLQGGSKANFAQIS